VQVGAKVAEEWALRILFSLLLDDTVCFLMKKKHCSGLNSPKDYLWPTVNQVVAARLQYKKLTHHHLIATRLPHTPYNIVAPQTQHTIKPSKLFSIRLRTFHPDL
jgi:hypothetical protein